MASTVEVGVLQWFLGTMLDASCSDLALGFYLLRLSNESMFVSSCLLVLEA